MTADLRWLDDDPRSIVARGAAAARARQETLTKPAGSLGDLETLAIRIAGWQRRERPTLERVHITVFAGDHGIAAEGVSAFPQAVTVEMLRNFARGGAAINVLARALGATFEVVNLGTVNPVAGGAHDRWLGPGTMSFAQDAAMSEAQLVAALDAGRQSVERAVAADAQLYIGGEIGIGNTTAATALACALLPAKSETLAGPGTGLDAQGVARKAAVIRHSLERHAGGLGSAAQILRRLGGFEIAALAGAYVRCAQVGLPALIDGFIATAAALVACRLRPRADVWWLFSHRSREPGHAALLAALQARPLLDLGMRLGEGSGAAMAVPILRLACELHGRMATFAEAGVSERL